MSVSTENPAPPLLSSPGSSRPVQEVVVTLAFAPVANILVRALQPTRVSPPAVVVAHGLVGLTAAIIIGLEALVLAAILLQVRTLLDNVDGRLARVTGRVTLTGRYLDTVVDFLVNAALFAVLGWVTGEPLLALAGFVALALVLTVDFNVSQLYAEAHARAVEAPAPTGGVAERALGGVYHAVFAPQDRLARTVVTRRLDRVLEGESDPMRIRDAMLAYHDRATVSILANLGLSTQLVVLGACLVLDAPAVYLWLTLGSLALLPVLQLRRERMARRALAT
ncbi:MAG: CDP-alcohol phosphatidyltransferase family protein [Gaiellaceae bacterium]